MGLPDYHVHLENGPYDIRWVEKFLKRACEAGLSEIGFSEHGHRFKEAESVLDVDWAREQCTQRVRDYVELVNESRLLGYPLKIRLGLEMDFVPGKRGEIAGFIGDWPWDYVIGSVHWDGTEALDDPQGRWAETELEDAWRRYFNLVASMASSGLYDIVGHFDVVKVNGQRPACGEDPLGADRALEAVAASGLCLEVSSAGLRRPVAEIYPGPGILRSARAKGIPVTLSSDAHEPEEVALGFDALEEALKAAGYREILTFEGRRARSAPFGAGGP